MIDEWWNLYHKQHITRPIVTDYKSFDILNIRKLICFPALVFFSKNCLGNHTVFIDGGGSAFYWLDLWIIAVLLDTTLKGKATIHRLCSFYLPSMHLATVFSSVANFSSLVPYQHNLSNVIPSLAEFLSRPSTLEWLQGSSHSSSTSRHLSDPHKLHNSSNMTFDSPYFRNNNLQPVTSNTLHRHTLSDCCQTEAV